MLNRHLNIVYKSWEQRTSSGNDVPAIGFLLFSILAFSLFPKGGGNIGIRERRATSFGRRSLRPASSPFCFVCVFRRCRCCCVLIALRVWGIFVWLFVEGKVRGMRRAPSGLHVSFYVQVIGAQKWFRALYLCFSF
jgi:hypothetical protein